MSNKLEELVILLSRYYSGLEATEAQALVRIGKVIDYLERNYNNNIYLDQLADMSNMSTRNFQRIFKKAVGSSPTSYLTQIRLQKARRFFTRNRYTNCRYSFRNRIFRCQLFHKMFQKNHWYNSCKIQNEI
jgi:AraC-like DNA-binding protein